MSDRTLHSEWLSLIDVSGPFLAEPVLKEAFPQGLGGLDSAKKTMLRQAYDEWREARDLDDPLLPKIHAAWIDLVLKQGLELDEQGKADVLKPRAALPETLACSLPEHGITLRPDFAVVDAAGQPLMLVAAYDPDVSLTDAKKGDGWAASPAERMVELCRGTQVRIGLLTNGEHWMFVDAPVNAATTMANWYARLWAQEPLTLQAFVNLLGIRRFFVDRSEQLPALLDKSLEHQDEVTDALGEQVRRAVEVLIQALERADVDRKRELLEGTAPSELYEAGLTVMMRIVFLLSAEERGLLLMGDPGYEANYAISTLRLQLRANSDEILERRQDAWSRLLSVFRAVYGGIDHDSMRLPALGGSLFDPDRYPFLEGRAKGSSWRTDPAKPLPIDNRTVLLLLEAVQLFQGRTLSYLALDVEQIGYVYEGLLERTAVRAGEVTLDLSATKNADNPWVTLPELDDAAAKGGKAVEELLKERTGSAVTRVRNDLSKQVVDASAEKLLAACQGDRDLRDRIKPFFHLLRTDPWGYPLVYPKGTFMVMTGSDRRETGTHYTPRSLTEAIVSETLESLVYIGPSEGKPREEWNLKTAEELLDLKICDPAMGSGAFLVQVCRWLAERVVEAWQAAEAQGKAITAEGDVHDALGANEPLRPDPAERLLTAKRLIAERCLYGVDMNPLAVELAKLSIWLVTLAKGRPFGFLDHNLRTGDSLLGITTVQQLSYLEMSPGCGSSKKLFALNVENAVTNAVTLRSELRKRPVRDIRDVDAMSNLDLEARTSLQLPILAADAFIGSVLAEGSVDSAGIALVAAAIGDAMGGDPAKVLSLQQCAVAATNVDLPSGKDSRHLFHWPLEYPEVFSDLRGGFDAIVGNPPFLGGQKITGAMGKRYRDFLVSFIADGAKGSADLSAYFFLRTFALLRESGNFGLLAVNTIAEGDTRQVGLERLLRDLGANIFAAYPNEPWPGTASVIISRVHIHKGQWDASAVLSGRVVPSISAFLSSQRDWSPKPLVENQEKSYIGSYVLGMGFVLTEEQAVAMIERDPKNRDVLFPYLNGKDLNTNPDQKPSRWVVNFWDWPEEKARLYVEPYQMALRLVKPERQRKKPSGEYQLRRPLPERWWQYGEKRPALYHAVGRGSSFVEHPGNWQEAELRFVKVLASARVGKYFNPSLVPNDLVFHEKIVVFATDKIESLAFLNSSIAQSWIWKHSSRLKMDLNFSPSDAFETLPFPDELTLIHLRDLGSRYNDLRSDLMRDRQIGLTKLYNCFHDPDDDDPRINKFRELQRQIDGVVATAYGWVDLNLDHGFHEMPYLAEGDRVRFTISENARIESLRRLADLNKARFEATPRGQIDRTEQNCELNEGLFAPPEDGRCG